MIRGDHWGEGYQVPEPELVEHGKCPVCSARHDKPVPWCARDNTQERPDDERD